MADNVIGVRINLNDLRIGSTYKLPKIAQDTTATKPNETVLAKPDKTEIKSVSKGNTANTINFSEITPVEIKKEIPTTHTVQKGETLSSIAKTYLGKENAYMQIFQLNKSKSFSHPNSVLKVGMVLKLPVNSDNTATKPDKKDSLSNYQKENPLSYITLGGKDKEPEVTNPQPEEQMSAEDAQNNERFYSQFSVNRNNSVSLGNTNVVSNDAVKVNKTFNLQPTFNYKSMKDADKWLTKVADTLKDNNASINIGANGKSLKINGEMLQAISNKISENKSEGTKMLKEMFEASGAAYTNGMFAIDDIVSNLKNDPYYGEIKGQEKTFDLAAVSDDFELCDDRNNYMSGVASHGHRQVPLILKTNEADLNQKNYGKTSNELIKDLSNFFDARGNMKDPKGFEKEVYKMLDDQHSRRVLIDHFNLGSKENVDSLIPAITAEAGAAKSQIDYDSYFAVGSVMMNRTLGKNLKNAAVGVARGKDPEKINAVSIKNIIYEQGQFEIAWRKQGGATIYDNHKSLNNLFKKDQLKEGNSKQSFEMAYEVANDLFAGMNKISATVDGVSVKNVGRSTSDLFYFNQSRSKDYSQQSNVDSAVALIDKNNTHVFFKAWDEKAYFR